MANHPSLEHENYLVLLELPFDEKELDADVVKAALHNKKQEWTRLQNNPGKRGMALKYLDLAPEIEKALLNPVTRAKQAEAARELRADMIRRMEAELRVLETKGYLTPKEVTAVSVKYRAWGVDKQAVEQAARCPIGDAAPRPGRPAETPEPEEEILDRITARAIERGLGVLGLGTLYEFLELAQYSSIQKLSDAAEAKRKSAQQSAAKTAAVTATQELAGICQKVFADFGSKQKYDRYLKVSKYPALGELIDEEHARSSYVSPGVVLRLVNFAVETYGIGVLEAEEYIRNYCATYDIPLGERHRTVSCPHCSEQVDRQAPLCTACGAPLRGECPGCGSPFSEGISLCPDCGFALGDMGKALRHIDDAQNALIENSWGTAQRNVQYAKKYWPGHPQIEALEKRAISLEERYGWYVDNVKDCVQHNQYYAALELIQEAEARRIRLPGTAVEHVAKVIAEFETKLAALTAQGNPTIEQVLKLGDLVGDSIELSRMMKQHPPHEPDGLRAVLADKRVLLSWGPSPSPGLIEYILVRKKGAKPLTPFDGDALYKGRGTSYEDNSIESLNEYYYCVFAGRGGAYSLMGPSAGPVLLIPEIEDLLILPIDHGAQFRWKHNPYIKHVTLWRKLGGEKPTAPGEGYKLETTRIDGFTDTKIKNDVDYWYYLVATYAVDGREVHSKGVLGHVTPHRFVAPVESLVVVKTDDGEDSYVANWQSTEHSDVLLLASNRRPEHYSGDIMPVDQLLSHYRRLDADPRGESSARFTLSLNGGIWVFAAAVFGKFASVSQYFYLTNVKNVEHPTYDLVGDELYINMKWPTGLQEIAVAYRLDKFPQQPDEMGATMMHITREQYDYDAAVVLREPEETAYYAKIFSKFVTPDGAVVYSDGVELLIDNTPQQELFYDVKLKKKLLAKMGIMSITISSSEPFRLPRALFMSKVGRIPLSKVDGVSLFEIEKETNVDGEITFEFETEGLPEDLYIRMFLHDNAGYAKYHLLPSTSMKIS